MNLLLVIKYHNFFSRIIITDTNSVHSAIESSNSRIPICLCDNTQALDKLERIMAGKAKPHVTYLAGNSYFGKVKFKYTRPDKKSSPDVIYELPVSVYSALGTTVSEHDARYKRIKAAKLSKTDFLNNKGIQGNGWK